MREKTRVENAMAGSPVKDDEHQRCIRGMATSAEEQKHVCETVDSWILSAVRTCGADTAKGSCEETKGAMTKRNSRRGSEGTYYFPPASERKMA